MQQFHFIARYGYSICTLILALQVLIPRICLIGYDSIEGTVILAGYCLSLGILGLIPHRLQGGIRGLLASALFIAWIPVLWLSLTTHHHAFFPFPILFLVLAFGGLLTAVSLKLSSSGPMLAVFTVVILIIVIDRVVPAEQPSVILDKRPEIFAIPDSIRGYRPAPDTEVKITCWKDDRIVYHIRYHFDGYSRRVVPGTPLPGTPRTTHVIFMGGSCTFGENINDFETLPAMFATRSPECDVYNYAFIGYGPQQMLALLESGLLRKQIPTSSGVLLYGVIPDHVRRASGSYTALSWGRDFPRYVRSKGKLKRVGSFAESERRLTTFYDYLRLSPSLDYLAKYLDATFSFRPSRWSYFLDIVEESRRLYREQFEGELMVFFWPLTPRSYATLRDSVRSRGVPVLDLSGNIVQLDDDSLFVPYDVHPSGRYNNVMAGALTRALLDVNSIPGVLVDVNDREDNMP